VLLAKWYQARLTGVFVYTPMFSPIPDFALPGLVTSPALTDSSGALDDQLAVFSGPRRRPASRRNGGWRSVTRRLKSSAQRNKPAPTCW
jgi:hypothetical protein